MKVGAGNNCFSFSLCIWGLHLVADLSWGYQEAPCGVDLGACGVVMEASPLLPASHFPLLLLLHEEGSPVCVQLPSS